MFFVGGFLLFLEVWIHWFQANWDIKSGKVNRLSKSTWHLELLDNSCLVYGCFSHHGRALFVLIINPKLMLEGDLNEAEMRRTISRKFRKMLRLLASLLTLDKQPWSWADWPTIKHIPPLLHRRRIRVLSLRGTYFFHLSTSRIWELIACEATESTLECMYVVVCTSPYWLEPILVGAIINHVPISYRNVAAGSYYLCLQEATMIFHSYKSCGSSKSVIYIQSGFISWNND